MERLSRPLKDLLTPPAKCEAYLAMKYLDKRKGGIWHCDLAEKNIGGGKTRPECLCAKALIAQQEADNE